MLQVGVTNRFSCLVSKNLQIEFGVASEMEMHLVNFDKFVDFEIDAVIFKRARFHGFMAKTWRLNFLHFQLTQGHVQYATLKRVRF